MTESYKVIKSLLKQGITVNQAEPATWPDPRAGTRSKILN